MLKICRKGGGETILARKTIDKNGAFFYNNSESSLRRLIDDAGGFRDVSLWTTGDARPDRADEKWVNLLCRAD